MKSNLLLTLAILVYSHTISYGQVTIVNDGGEVLLKSASGNGMHIDGDLYTNVLISVNDLVFRSNNTLSGRLNASSRNTSLGCWSLSKNTSGSNNSAIGHISLYRNTTGSFNTVIGKQSLCNGDTGSYNTSLGGSTLFANTSDSNTVVGAIAMQSNTTGNQNTCLGSWSMWSNSTGTGNTVAGSNTLNSNSSGTNNTAVGYYADVSTGNLTNAIAIGAGAVVTNSNAIRLGNTSIISLECQVGLSVTSDARFKYNVQQNVPGLDFIQKLKPVTYQFDLQKIEIFMQTGVMPETINTAPGSPVHTGFLAQEVEKAAADLGYAFDGVHRPRNEREYYTLDYTKFIMPLVKAVQEQQLQIEKQQAEIKAVKSDNKKFVVQSEKAEEMEMIRLEAMAFSIREICKQLNNFALLKMSAEQTAKK